MTYEEIRPIECIRGDVRFRSTLEARWSLAFDKLHLEWEYEPQTFPLISGRLYTPDFLVGSHWVEIKPTAQALRDVEKKLHAFAQNLPGRFFSFTASFPSFGFAGRPTVIEWTDEGVRWVSQEEALDVFCAETEFRAEFPVLYAVYVSQVFEAARFARFNHPTKVSFLMEGD